MKQILIILTLCFTINEIIGSTLGHGLVIGNCPAVEVNQEGEVTCIYIVDGYIQVELKKDDPYQLDNPFSPNIDPIISTNSVTGSYKVDVSSIDGFTDHGIPLSEVYNGGYMVNIPASDWNYSTFFFYVWIKDEDGRIVKHYSWKIKDLDICSGTPSLRLSQEYTSSLFETELTNEKDDNFKMFPNPVYHNVNIEIPILQTGTIVVELFNEKGQLIYTNSDQVFENTAYHKQINNLHILKGVYICRITTDYGKKYTSKIVKL